MPPGREFLEAHKQEGVAYVRNVCATRLARNKEQHNPPSTSRINVIREYKAAQARVSSTHV